MKAIGPNLSNASFTLTRLYRNARKHGGPYRRGVHEVLPADGVLPLVTKMTTTSMMMRATATKAVTTAETTQDTIVMNREDEGSTNPPPSPRRPPPMHEQQPQFNPPPPMQYNPKRWLNDKKICIQVGRSMFQSLTILGLGLEASETEIRVHYRQLACKYHPDKNDPAITGLSASEASAFFQLLNNAHQYLKDRA
jgi:hypothetical protein